MSKKKGRRSSDPASAPESGTERDDTSGNKPSDRNNVSRPSDPNKRRQPEPAERPARNEPSHAGEEP